MKDRTHRASFATQYTSLMLIILSVVVSSRFQILTQHQAYALAPEALVQQEAARIGQMEYADLFDRSSERINEELASALVELVSLHDVDVSIQVYLSTEEVGGDEIQALSLALARAMRLSQYFAVRASGGAVTISVIEEERGTLAGPAQASALFTQAAGRNNE